MTILEDLANETRILSERHHLELSEIEANLSQRVREKEKLKAEVAENALEISVANESRIAKSKEIKEIEQSVKQDYVLKAIRKGVPISSIAESLEVGHSRVRQIRDRGLRIAEILKNKTHP